MANERFNRRKQMMEKPELYDPTLMGTPAKFGPIQGIPVFRVFNNRMDCYASNVHRRPRAGIAGTQRDGAESICISDGYEDDKDDGEFFIYTGTGGQEDSSYGGGGPQVEDQTFDHRDNAALKLSVTTRRPVRVVRGPNEHSRWAPAQGYRYDGLYTVEKAYLGKGKRGFAVCKYELRRIPGQPAIPPNPAFIGDSNV